MSENAVMPFGKYKGTPIAEVVASDPGYIEWAMAQENVREKIGSIVVNIIHATPTGPNASETPQHNLMQAEYFNEEAVNAVLCTLGLSKTPVMRAATGQELLDHWKTHGTHIDPREWRGTQDKLVWEQYWGREKIGKYERVEGHRTPQFVERLMNDKEKSALEEEIRASRYTGEVPTGQTSYHVKNLMIELAGWDIVVNFYAKEYGGKIGLELKPSIGDDYPAVLRQVTTRLKNSVRYSQLSLSEVVVVYNKYTGSVPIATVVSMFKASGVRLISHSDVEKQRSDKNVLEFAAISGV